MSATGRDQTAFHEAPFGWFHARITAAATGGVFSDGYGLGILGLALNQATVPLKLDAVWLGAVGAAALLGLFLGALATGPLADTYGRRRIFASNMALLLVLSISQLWVHTASELLTLRFLIGLMLGSDYVISKTLLSECIPIAQRGRVLSSLAIAWATGYTSAYLVGYGLLDVGADAWRWMLATSAVPCVLLLPWRWTTQESPMWLVAKRQTGKADAIVRQHLGPHIAPPPAPQGPQETPHPWRWLGQRQYRRHRIAACTLFTAQVIPYFALGTFVTRILQDLKVNGALAAGLVYNGALLLGAIIGVLVIDRLPRRRFIIGSFSITGAALLPLTVPGTLPTSITVLLFALFAGVLSAATSLVYVYLPELFPPPIRASGIGLAVASSRIGSMISTFALPLVVASAGVHTALGLCAGVLLAGAAISYQWAPETHPSLVSPQRTH